MDTDHREEMLKLRVELLLVEEERKVGKEIYTIDELEKSQMKLLIIQNSQASNPDCFT